MGLALVSRPILIIYCKRKTIKGNKKDQKVTNFR